MKITEGKEFMPQTGKEETTIQFNYFRGDELINIKYRTGDKNFKMASKAELIFYNLNALEAYTSIIITEGEVDCLSYLQCGIKYVVSVPNGASKGSMKLEYLDNCWKAFEKIEKIYLATDNDEAGIALRSELARRLGTERCYTVNYRDVKDANEYLLKYGQAELEETIYKATPIPISGVVYVNDISDEIDNLYREGMKKGKTIGIDEFDKFVSFDGGHKTIVTGVPSLFSPENYPLSYHFSKLAEKLIGARFNGQIRMTEDDKELAKLYLNDNFFFIRPDNEVYTIENVLDKARQLILRYGVKIIVIDPYNRLEHEMEKGESETNYISKLLDKITTFCQTYNVHAFIVAHPTKIKKIEQTQSYEIPTLYDISGSANWFNKADIGMTVYRNETGDTTVYIQKVRFRHLGEKGFCDFKWNPENGRYFTYLSDNSKWITLTK